MPMNLTDLEVIRREIIEAARKGNPDCALASLKEAHAALDGATDPALEYLQECIGRLLMGKDARKAFNLGKRKRGGQPDPNKPISDELLRFEVRLLHLGAAALGLQDKVDGIAERLGVSREEAIEGGETIEESIIKVAETHHESSETVRTAYYGRR
jgi:hypothetical protein